MRTLDREIVHLAVPALGGLAIEPLYVLADTAIVGRLGTAPLAGLALASTVLLTTFWLCSFLAYGTTARVAAAIGRRDSTSAARTAVQGLWFALVAGLVMALVLLAAGPALLRALGGRGDVLRDATAYLRISAIGAPAVLVMLVGHGYFRGLQDTRTPLVVALASNAFNIVFQVFLIYGLGFDIAGSALATVAAQLGGAAWLGVLCWRKVRASGASLRPHAGEMKALLKIGRHLVIRTGALLATLVLASAVAARMSDATLAAHQIGIQVFTFLALAVDALAIAAQAMVGKALGAGDKAFGRLIAMRLMKIGLACGIVIGVVLAASSAFLPSLFTPDSRVADLARIALLAVAVMQVPGAVVFVLDGILIGASDTAFLQWGTVVALALFAPVAAVLIRRPELGIGALYAGLIGAMCVRLVFNGGRFLSGRWAV